MPGLRCQECGTTDEFELGDGTGYCRVCGTQSQDIREEVVELDETVFSQHNTTVRRVAKGLNSTKSAAKPERIWTVTEAVQAVLLIQTNSLIRAGVPQQLKNIVGNVWFRFLAKIGTINLPKVEPVVLTDIYTISIFDNLAILYLSLLLINYPVLYSDILDWIMDGTLCYFNSNRLLPEYFKPKKLLKSSLRVRGLPTLKNMKERVEIIAEILDDVPKPILQFSSLEAHFKRLITKFNVTEGDVNLLCIGLFKRFYKSEIQIHSNVEIIIAACFITALRLFYQFENPESPKQPWLLWFLSYLRCRHKNNVGHIVEKSILERHCYITEKHFLNMSLDEYLTSAEAIIAQHDKVFKLSNATDGLKYQFSSFFDDKPEKHTENIEQPRRVRSGKRKYKKRSAGLQCNRQMVVYPVDVMMEESILPLELQLIVDDVAACFHITSSDLFAEIQSLARLFDSS